MDMTTDPHSTGNVASAPRDEDELIEAALRQEHCPEAPTSRPCVPPDAFAGYEILELISSGGQGMVYRARQHGTNRDVAIKILRDGQHASETSKRRFEREIELIGQLSHPNIVAIFQPGITNTGQPYYVMDYVPGRPLHRY